MNEHIKNPEIEGAFLQVRKIGNSFGLHLTPYDPVHAKGMEIARKAFKTYANTFRELAK